MSAVAEMLRRERIKDVARGRREGRAEGRAEGREEGRKENKLEIAKNMLKENMSIDIISRVTGLSEKEVEELKLELRR